MNTNRHRHDICPWWQAYFFDNPLRRVLHSPRKLFSEYLSQGMTAVDIGCGMGFFSIAMAKMVGPQGKILAVDLQPQMLAVVRRRAIRKGVNPIIETHRCHENRLGLSVNADFVLLFWSMHEIADVESLAGEIMGALKPGGYCFVAEPAFHVGVMTMENQVETLTRAGLQQINRPSVSLSRGALLRKPRQTG